MAARCPHPAAAIDTNSSSKRDVKTRKRSRQCERTRKAPEDNIQAEKNLKPKRRAVSTCHWSQWQWWQERKWWQEMWSSNCEPEHFSPWSCRKCFVFRKSQPSPLLSRGSFCTPCSGSGQSWSLLEALSHGARALATGSSYPCEGAPRPSLLHHQAKCSPTLPAVQYCYLLFSKRQALKRLGERKRSKFTCPLPQCTHKADKIQPN